MFDRFVAVDWSARSSPTRGRDAIWIAVSDGGVPSASNPPTREAAVAEIVELADPQRRTIVGVDFSLGYPAGTARRLGLCGAPWSAMWALLAAEIVDGADNANNRFSVANDLNRILTGRAAPFWGCPPAARGAFLTTNRPPPAPDDLPTWRTVEACLRGQRHRPFSSWQLLGAGAVGSQSLLGIPRLHRLREQLGRPVEVWPFTTGLRRPEVSAGSVVLAEVWPRLVPFDTSEAIADEAQVVGVAQWLAEAAAADRLGRLFEPAVADAHAEVIVAEEGWVLGVEPTSCVGEGG